VDRGVERGVAAEPPVHVNHVRFGDADPPGNDLSTIALYITSLESAPFRVPLFVPGGCSFVAAPSTARGLPRTGRHRIGLDAREGAPLVENRPRDARKLIGQRNAKQPGSCWSSSGANQWERYMLESWIEAAKKRLHHNVCLNEEGAQIAIAAP
jgi:hypothetical protein